MNDPDQEECRRSTLKLIRQTHGSFVVWVDYLLSRGMNDARITRLATGRGFPDEQVRAALTALRVLRHPDPAARKRFERRQSSHERVHENHGSTEAWVAQMRAQGMSDPFIRQYATSRGHFDEEMDGALIGLKWGPMECCAIPEYAPRGLGDVPGGE